MNATAKTILVIALVTVAAVVLLFGDALMTVQLLGAAATGTGKSDGAGFGGYLTILMLVDVGLGTVVAWMLFGKRE